VTVTLSLEAYQRLDQLASAVLNATSIDAIKSTAQQELEWLHEQAAAASTHAEAIAKAMLETDDDLVIDEHPIVSEAEEGVWVNSWLWVPADTPDE